MRKPPYIFLAMLIWLLLSSLSNAMGQSVIVTSEMLQEGEVSLSRFPEENWRFHPGDSLNWASPDYDDSHWDTHWTSKLSLGDSLYTAAWKGIGWFRLSLNVADTTVHNFLLNAEGYGVAELYVNGERRFSNGIFPAEGRELGEVGDIDESVLLDAQGDRTYTLAIRYANRVPSRVLTSILYSNSSLGFGLAPGLRISMVSPEKQNAVSRASVPEYILESVFTGMYCIVALLGALLFLLGVRDKVLLYLTLSVSGLASYFGVALLQYLSLGINWEFPAIVYLTNWAIWPALICLGIGVRLAFFPERRFLRILMLVMGGMIIVSSFGFGNLFSNFFLAVLTGLIGLIAGMTLVAMWQRKPGAWSLGFGLLVASSIFIFFYLMIVFQISFGSQELLFNLLIYGAQSLVPISIGSLIIARYTGTARDLKARLVEVEQLSDEKLAVEKDRQRLIETQKERLEDEVEIRTAELKATQAQLIEQEKLASLGSLTAGIAHEIKNPLNFVNNFAEVGGELADELDEAIEAGKTEEARSILAEMKANTEQITKHGRRADDIVKAMMQHARGGSSEKETIVVNEFLEEYANLAWHGRRAKDDGFQAELKRDFSNEVGSLDVMPQELGRVVLNLLNNAFDAVKGVKGAEVTLTTRKSMDHIEIRVSDNGPGIPDDIREKIFEPFFTTKATGEGTGLGLSLSYDIVTKGHGGTMTATNRPEGGAEFVITLDASPNRNAI